MGRVAFVTGGAGGIGAAVCRALAADGHKVAVADLARTDARSVADEIGGIAVDLDVTDLASVKRAVGAAIATFGPIEICVNCAGWDENKPFLDTSDEEIARMFEINLFGVMRVTREVLGPMVAARWGRIVNVSSDTARQGWPKGAPYSAAKAGVELFTKTIAAEYGHANIIANVMSPGPFETPLFVSAMGEDFPEVLAMLERSVPLGRVGKPSEAAAVIRFLASDEASYLSGQVISVNGALLRTG